MSTHVMKNQKVAHTLISSFPNVQPPESSWQTKTKYINSIYVGTMLRIYASEYGNERKLA